MDYETQLKHLVALAQQPAWKDYSWKRALELERCETGMWKGISQELKATMLALNPAAATAARAPTCAPQRQRRKTSTQPANGGR